MNSKAIDKISLAAANWSLGRYDQADLSGAATDALLEGLDTPSLRVLAAANTLEHDEKSKVLEQTLDELGLKLPTYDDAILVRAREILSGLINGVNSPQSVVREISSFNLSDELAPIFDQFVLLYSEFDDMVHEGVIKGGKSPKAESLLADWTDRAREAALNALQEIDKE